MNIFRLTADMSHLVAIFILLAKVGVYELILNHLSKLIACFLLVFFQHHYFISSDVENTLGFGNISSLAGIVCYCFHHQIPGSFYDIHFHLQHRDEGWFLPHMLHFMKSSNHTQVFFIISSYGTLYLMLVKFRPTYEKESDSFRVEFLLIPCVLLSFLINHEFTPMEILWTFRFLFVRFD